MDNDNNNGLSSAEQVAFEIYKEKMAKLAEMQFENDTEGLHNKEELLKQRREMEEKYPEFYDKYIDWLSDQF